MKYLYAMLAVVLVLAGGYALTRETAPEAAAPHATSTAAASTASTSTLPSILDYEDEELPLEPTFVLPAGAVKIDGYAYSLDGEVKFRSLVDPKSSLKVPTADPATFRRLQDFMTFPGREVVSDCGAAPLYAYYVDKHRPYIYQVWRAPTFRASTITAMNGADADSFTITSLLNANDDRTSFELAYRVATSTCELYLDQVPL